MSPAGRPDIRGIAEEEPPSALSSELFDAARGPPPHIPALAAVVRITANTDLRRDQLRRREWEDVDNLSGSGADYGFDLTPSGEGLVTADIAGAVAQDAASNDNTAASQFSRSYLWHPVPAAGKWALLALVALLAFAGTTAAVRLRAPCRL